MGPWEEDAGPGFGHLKLAFIIPVRPTFSSGMMRYFSNGYGGVSALSEPCWETGVSKVFGTNEKSSVVRRAIPPRQKSVTGSSAGWGLNIMPVERPSFFREAINVG